MDNTSDTVSCKNEKLNPDKTKDTSQGKGEKTLLLEDIKHRVDFSKAVHLRQFAIVLAWLTVVFLLGLSIATIVLSTEYHSSSALAVALDTLLDVATSAVVIWRYSGVATLANLYSSCKERKACLFLGFLCYLMAAVLLCRSAYSLAQGYQVHDHSQLLTVSIVTATLCLFLTIGKGYTAWQLESISIGTDAVNSFLGFVLALSAIVSYTTSSQHFWFIDSTVGVCAGGLLVIYGTWVIVYEFRKS